MRRVRLFAALGVAAVALAGCQVSELSTGAHLAPLPSGLERKITRMNMRARSPIMLRIYKDESELEVWKEDKQGKYQLLKTYEICAWSGELGPKLKEGDRQAPEGFYTVTRGQMNPNSSYHLSFNLGFPNRFDRSHGRTGSNLMVHGDCSSRGCYAMEDGQIQEIYALAREAFAGGQSAFQVQAFPFRMTPENMAKHHDSEHLAFWEMLKEGADHFDVSQQAPRIDVCGRRYVFNAKGGRFDATGPCPAFTVDPALANRVAAKRNEDLQKREQLIARMQAKEEREQRWEQREATIANIFNRSREDTDTAETDAESGTEAAAAVPSTAAPVPSDTPATPEPAPAEPAGTPAPVASIAADTPAAEPDPEEAPMRPVDESTPMGFAPEEDDAGFFSSVAKSSRGLFRRAGDIFN